MVATIFFSLAFLSSSVSMANLSSSVATVFSSFSVFVRLLSQSGSCLEWISIKISFIAISNFHREVYREVLISSLSFLSKSFSSPRYKSYENGQALFLVVFRFLPPTLFGLRQTHYIYHAKPRLNTPVWGSLPSPNNLIRRAKRAPHWDVQSRFRVILYIIVRR